MSATTPDAAPTGVSPSFWGELINSTVVTAGGDVHLTLANGASVSVRPEDWPDSAALVARTTRWFVGRSFVFEAIAQFLKRQPRGYFHVVADAGLGKTAIAAELIKRYRTPGYFLSVSAGRTRPDLALNAISAQLIVRYALPHSSLPPQAGETSDTVYHLLQEAASNPVHRPVLAVIDALDEADPTPSGHNWLHLPGDLPDGVLPDLDSSPRRLCDPV